MKICHLSLCGPYNEGWGYQENILPKYHVKQGHEVYQIVTPYMWEGSLLVKSSDVAYKNANGVNIIRSKEKQAAFGGNRFNKYPELFPKLREISPDVLFVHGCQFLDIDQVVKYLKKNPETVVYVDNHADFSNSATNWLSKNILHKIVWRRCARLIEPYARKFYGVLPARVDFLKDVYGLPEEKCELLVMGADDDLVEAACAPEVRERLRVKYGIRQEDFLIVTGGKIDRWKTQILLLMQAVRELRAENVKLLVFGSVVPELKAQLESLVDDEKVKYVGWITALESFDFFSAADLAVFPCRHSVMWEQAAGQGIPLIVKDWEGTRHVDLGGNVKFLYNDSVEEIKDAIELLINCPEKYSEMKSVAEDKGMKVFSYNEIAKRAIET